MNAEQFRRRALALPGVIEASHGSHHGGHPDFRLGRRIFATLGYPDADFGMVKLTAEQQAILVAAEPKIFAPVPSGWGRRGSTNVHLKAADAATLASALSMAWGNVAPRSLMKSDRSAEPDGSRTKNRSTGSRSARIRERP